MTQKHFDLRQNFYLNTSIFIKYLWEDTQIASYIGCLWGEAGGGDLELGETFLYSPFMHI